MNDQVVSNGGTQSNITPSAEDVAKAEEFKSRANKLFEESKFAQAVEAYEEAIKLNPNNAVYWSNKAFALTKLEQYGAALTEATKAIELDKTYAKGYYRRGSALVALGKYKDALKDFKLVVQIYPKNKEAQDKLKQCEKVVKKMAFESAIAGDYDAKPVSETIDPDKIEIESSYDGLHMPETLTLQFVKDFMEYFKNQKKLHVKYVYKILLAMNKHLKSLETLIEIPIPEKTTFKVCGDVHGQFYDLYHLFELSGLPGPDNPYLFNGDFVDRGSFSVEVILTLFAFVLLYPKHMHLTRGNHESLNLNRMYGFEGEVLNKYSKNVFDLFTEVFTWLPLAAVLNNKVFVVHGGLFSRDGVTLKDIKAISRNRQPPDEGLMCEMLWSDPQPMPGRSPNKRGVGVAFGPDVTHRFLNDNNLELLVRSHEVKDEGYHVEADGKCITIFSAPNYCDQVGNKGAFITFDSTLKPKFTTFAAVPHPPVKPMAYASNFNSFW